MWPSYKDRADLPAFDGYPVVATLREPTDGDFEPAPCSIGDTCPVDRNIPKLSPAGSEGLGPFQAAVITGTIAPDVAPESSEEPSWGFCETPTSDGLDDYYRGDVDVFLVELVDVNAVCLVLTRENEPADAEEWDATIFAFNGTEQCPEAPFLSPNIEGSPAVIHLPGTQFIDLGGPGTYAIAIAYANAVPESPKPYRLYVLPARNSPRGCLDPYDSTELNADDFEDEE